MLLVLLALLAQAGAFDYDADAPLSVEMSSVDVIDGVGLREISYASPMGGRVPGFLIAPSGGGPHAGVVFVHWGQGNRSEFVSEALVYARAGAVSLLIDAPHMRPENRGNPTGFRNPDGERAMYVQLVVDVRRAFDVLVARDDVDADRLGYVGHSLGATWGGAIAGVEHRVHAFVLMGGLPNLVDRGTSYQEDMWLQIEEAFTEEELAAYRAVMAPLSPERFVAQSPPGSIFFQFARYDRFISDAAAAAYEHAAREPHVRWYETSHELNDLDSLRDRAEWLREKLDLAPVLPLLREKLAP